MAIDTRYQVTPDELKQGVGAGQSGREAYYNRFPESRPGYVAPTANTNQADLNSITQIGGGQYKDKSGATFTLSGGTAGSPIYTKVGGGLPAATPTNTAVTLPEGTKAPEQSYNNLLAQGSPQMMPDQEQAIKERTRREMQGRIDSINEMTRQLMIQENQAGEQRTGQANVLAARGGMVGSTAGFSMGQAADKETAQQKQFVLAQQNQKLQEVYGIIDKAALDAVKLAKEESLGLYKNKLETTKALQDQAIQMVSDLGATGAEWSALPEDVKEYIRKTTGQSDFSLTLKAQASLPDSMKPSTHDYFTADENGNAVINHVTWNPMTKKSETVTEALGIPYASAAGKELKIVDGVGYMETSPGKLEAVTGKSDMAKLEEEKLRAEINKINKDAIGNSTNNSTFDHFAKQQIALSVMSTQLRNSDAEREFLLQGIDKGLAEGKSPYEVSDILQGYNIENKDTFSDNIRQYMAMDPNSLKVDPGSYARLINSGNRIAAVNKLETSTLKGTDGKEREALARYTTEKGNSILEQISKSKKLGAVAGRTEKLSSNLLASPEFVKLAADIVAFNAEWRKKMAGVQVTEQELKFMDDIMATYKDNPVNAAMKIESFKQMTVDSLNSVRESYALPRLTEETLNDNNKRVKIYELNLEEKELYDSGYSLEQIKQLKEAQ